MTVITGEGYNGGNMSIATIQHNKTLPPAYDFNDDPDALLKWLDNIECLAISSREYYAKRNALLLIETLRHVGKKMLQPHSEFIALCKMGDSISIEEAGKKSVFHNLLRHLQDEFHWDAMRLQKYADEIAADICKNNLPKDFPTSLFPASQVNILASELLIALHLILKAIRPYCDLNADNDQEVRRRADQGRGELMWSIDALLWGQVYFMHSSKRIETSRNEIHESNALTLAKLLFINGIGNTIFHLNLSKEMYEHYDKYIEIQGLIANNAFFRESYEYHAKNGKSNDWMLGTIMPLLTALDHARYFLSINENLPKIQTENRFPANGFLTPFSLDYLSHIDTLVPFIEQLLDEYLAAFVSEPVRINYPRKEEQPLMWQELKKQVIQNLETLIKQKGTEFLWVDSETFGNQPGIPETLLALQREGVLAITEMQTEKREEGLVCQLKLEDLHFNLTLNQSTVIASSEEPIQYLNVMTDTSSKNTQIWRVGEKKLSKSFHVDSAQGHLWVKLVQNIGTPIDKITLINTLKQITNRKDEKYFKIDKILENLIADLAKISGENAKNVATWFVQTKETICLEKLD